MTFAAATMMAGVLLAATACAGPAASEAPAAALETQAAVASASPAATPAEAPSAGTPSVVDGMDIKGPANNGKGDYLQTTIADNHPDMAYDPAVVDATIATQYSPVEIADAHMFVVRFIAEEGIDSTLNDGSDAESWWIENKDQIAPEYQATVKSLLIAGEEFVNRRSWGAANPQGFTYDYQAEKPRISDRKISTTSIFSVGDEDNSIIVKANVNYHVDLKTTDGSPQQASVSGFMQYAVRQDAATGNWLINGQKSEYEGNLTSN